VIAPSSPTVDRVALTFDDGPHPICTPRLLDLAAERRAALTFFVIGSAVKKEASLLRRAIAEGHEIGNHSWSHPDLSLLPNNLLEAELDRTHRAIFDATGVSAKIMRPPYGALTKAQRLWIAQRFDYQVVFWNIDPLDWKRPGAEVIADRLLRELRPGNIAISHDTCSQTVEAMPAVIAALQNRGWLLSTVSELSAAMRRVGGSYP
jgi:peptidoglycan/xylan/chitin deacetylase (PgdA/CDA1 family)